MFNYYYYEKKLKEKQDLDRQKNQYLIDKEKRKERNQKYAAAYKKRVENFVVNMMESPIVVTDYKGPKEMQFRQDQPDKFVGDAQIYVKGFKREQDRINMALESNKNLLFEPSISIKNYDYRPRYAEKEIQPELRFTSFKTSLDRVQAFVATHFMNEIENEDFRNSATKKKIQIFDSVADSLAGQEKKAFLAQEIAKNVMPSLHKKTHFKAVSEIKNKMPVSLTDKKLLQNEENNYKQTLVENKTTPNLTKLKVSKIEKDQIVGNILGELDNITEMTARTPKKSGLARVMINTDRNSQKDEIVENSQIQYNQQITGSTQGGGTKTFQFAGRQSVQLTDNQSKSVQPKQKKSASIGQEGFNPVESSKYILESCNFSKKRNEKIKVIHPGDGHLISTNEKTIREVYNDLDMYKSQHYSKQAFNQSSILGTTRSQTNINGSSINVQPNSRQQCVE